jgi:putative hydrolase of the HAD superfamily
MEIKAIFFDLGETLVTQNRKWIAGAKSTIESLANQGLRLGIISNTGNLTREQVKQLLPSDFDFSLFENELVILSSEVGLEKPDLPIFQLIVKRAQIKSEECLFCTENLIDTLVAQRIGLKTLRLLPAPQSDIGGIVDHLKNAGLIN